MIQPFRKFHITVDWIDENSREKKSSNEIINLHDIRNYGEHNEFNDNIPRTVITFMNGQFMVARINWKEFDRVMSEFLREIGLLDERSSKKKVNKEGLMKYVFNVNSPYVVACSYPTRFNMEDARAEDWVQNMIWHNVTTYN